MAKQKITSIRVIPNESMLEISFVGGMRLLLSYQALEFMIEYFTNKQPLRPVSRQTPIFPPNDELPSGEALEALEMIVGEILERIANESKEE